MVSQIPAKDSSFKPAVQVRFLQAPKRSGRPRLETWSCSVRRTETLSSGSFEDVKPKR